MSETKSQLPAIPDTVQPTIKAKFNIALTENKFQAIADEAARLEITEDNIDDVKEFLARGRKVELAIEAAHKAGKEESLKIGRNWDLAKNSFLSQAAFILNPVREKFNSVCKAVHDRQVAQENEKKRVDDIKSGMENNLVEFSKRISECESTQALVEIERKINLEKTRKEKYQEFLPEFVEKLTSLNDILKTQKEALLKKEEAEKKELEARQSGDDAAAIAAMEEKELAQADVEQNRINVQEKAIEQASTSANIPVTPTVFPAVKAKRTTWKWEVVDIKETSKKMPQWVKMETEDEKIDEFLKGKKAEGITGKEFTVAGIRFYEEKTF